MTRCPGDQEQARLSRRRPAWCQAALELHALLWRTVPGTRPRPFSPVTMRQTLPRALLFWVRCWKVGLTGDIALPVPTGPFSISKISALCPLHV